MDETWRTLVRVTRVYPEEVRVVVPGWDTQQDVGVPVAEFPFEPEVGKRHHAKVNLSARYPEQLRFSEWEED